MWLFLLAAVASGAACFSSERGETFYGRVAERPKPELRWSDGGLPRVFDPALASAAPDTNAVRALFEGLTEYDPKTLKPLPAVAERWTSTDEARTWTFYLRPGARWSNGDAVVAADFVRAWKRAVDLGERVPHRALLSNLRGVRRTERKSIEVEEAANGEVRVTERGTADAHTEVEDAEAKDAEVKAVNPMTAANAQPASETESFGVEAVNPRVLRVHLIKSAPDFPAIVAHTLFRPVHEKNLVAANADNSIPPTAEADGEANAVVTPPTVFDPQISNGAFTLAGSSPSEIVLARSANYWDAASVQLQNVRFVSADDNEKKLALYRGGEIDVVSNAAFEPLTVKLLAPHEDFRRATFGALNYYVFNRRLAPFDDARIREAFSISIDRRRLVRDTLGGTGEPAYAFLPREMIETENATTSTAEPRPDARRARQLLSAAGFPEGADFPIVRLLVNRNETHRAVAQAVAAMWRDALGVKTEIIVKDWADYEAAFASGDYSVARRSLVMQTPDERTNIVAMFDGETHESVSVANGDTVPDDEPAPSPTPTASPVPPIPGTDAPPDSAAKVAPASAVVRRITTHEEALRELPGIPLYFASSYALVKPYVLNFDRNVFDAPLLKRVRIDGGWVAPTGGSRIKVEGE